MSAAGAGGEGGGPIFIMGAMGSGTTLLRLILDSHPHIAVPPETGFMRAYNAHKFIPFKWTGRQWAKRLGWSSQELDAQLRAFYDTLFMRYVEQHGKRRWGEKTPLHVWHIDAMAKLFPDSLFVGIVRHPGGSIASNVNRWKLSLKRSIGHYERYTREIVRQAAAWPDRFAVLRYEELLLRPEPVLRELVDWLGEPWSDQVLEHHVVQGARADGAFVEGHNKADEPLDASRIAKFKTQFDAREQAEVARRTRRLAEFLGYDVEDPAVLEPLASDGRLVVGGAALAQRMGRFADLELEVQAQVPRFDRLYHPRELTLAAVDQEPNLVPMPSANPPKAVAASPVAANGTRPDPVRRAAVSVARRLPPAARRRLQSAVRRARPR